MKNDFWSDQPKNISAQDTSIQSKTLRTKLCQNGEKWGENPMNDELVLCRQNPEKSTLSHQYRSYYDNCYYYHDPKCLEASKTIRQKGFRDDNI